jgi:hypothetical protein
VTLRPFVLAGVFLAVAMAVRADVAPSPEDEESFRRLEPHMVVAGLRIEEATLESAMRRLGAVDRRDWMKAKAPYVCWAGPDGTRLGLGFGTSGGLLVLRRFEVAGAGAELEHVPGYTIPPADRPTCKAVKRLPADTEGRLRVGMTKAEVIVLLGASSDGSGGSAWSYVGSVKLELSQAQRDILLEAGVRPEDFLVERELRLEFRKDRLVAIRARQLTRG